MDLVSLSVVTYNTSISDLNNVYNSILQTELNWKLYVIDNSPTDLLRGFAERDSRIIYTFNNNNIGFGAGHNIAISESIRDGVAFHFIVNPDIYFDGDVMTPMIKYMKTDTHIGMMMPKVLYPDGSIQYLPKLLPNIFWIFWRKLKFPKNAYNKFIDQYELRSVPSNRIYNAPIISGCFSLLNLRAIQKLGGYDENFFMYFEDFDLSRRIHSEFKTLYFPEVHVIHGYESGANRNFKLFKIFVESAFVYFNKWGWFFDSGRKAINRQVIKDIFVD